MDAKNILNADLLDIIFDGRNKEYGAYDLRKTYNTRLRNSVMITLGLFLVIIVGNVIARNVGSRNIPSQPVVNDTISLNNPPKDPPPPLHPPKLPPVKTTKVTPPLIVKDKDVPEPPPENKDFIDAKVDVKTQAGDPDNRVAPPQVDNNSKVIIVSVDDNTIFEKVENEAQFPGGDVAWARYVTKAVTNNIDELTEAGESGTVHIKFVVFKDGSVSEVEAIDMKGTKLAEVAINAIRKGPKWVPAVQNGNKVNAYRVQPVTFNVQEP